jgi:hypothetical protein
LQPSKSAPTTPVAARPASDSIPVLTLRFAQPQDGPGFGVRSSLSSRLKERASHWTIDFVPRVRAFRIAYDRDGVSEVAYIPETRVAVWHPAE